MINDAAKLISESMTKWTQDITNAMGRPFVVSDVKVVSVPQNTRSFSIDTKILIDNERFEPNVTKVIISEGEAPSQPIDIEVHEKALISAFPTIPEEEQTSWFSPNFEGMEAAGFPIQPVAPLFSPLINELQAQNHALTNQVCELKSKIVEHQNALEAMEEGNARTQLNFATKYEQSANAKHQTLIFENERLSSDISEKNNKIKELEQKVASLTIENELQNANHQELSAALNISANTIGDLKQKLTQQEKKANQMKIEYEELQEASALNEGPTKTQLEDKITNLTKENNKLTNELDLAEEELHLINKSHQKEVENLKRQLLALSNKNTSLTDKVNDLQAQLSIYKDQEQ